MKVLAVIIGMFFATSVALATTNFSSSTIQSVTMEEEAKKDCPKGCKKECCKKKCDKKTEAEKAQCAKEKKACCKKKAAEESKEKK